MHEARTSGRCHCGVQTLKQAGDKYLAPPVAVQLSNFIQGHVQDFDTMINLDQYLVPGTTTTYYIPDFVTEDEEEYLIRKVPIKTLTSNLSNDSTPVPPRFRKHLSPGGSGYKIAGSLLSIGVEATYDSKIFRLQIWGQ